MHSAARTEIGCVRRRNEDAVLRRDDVGLWAVADGLGGHSAGDYASELIVERLASVRRTGGLLDFVEAVEDCLDTVNTDLRRAAAERGVAVIGSTVVLLIAGDDYSLCGWAGDSRGYAIEGQHARRLTRDHVEGGADNPEAPSAAAGSLALTRAVGANTQLFIDWAVVSNLEGDSFLLCSDGINKEVSDAELGALLQGKSPRNAVDDLIEAALSRGARDNVSAVVVTHDRVRSAHRA